MYNTVHSSKNKIFLLIVEKNKIIVLKNWWLQHHKNYTKSFQTPSTKQENREQLKSYEYHILFFDSGKKCVVEVSKFTDGFTKSKFSLKKGNNTPEEPRSKAHNGKYAILKDKVTDLKNVCHMCQKKERSSLVTSLKIV